MRLAQAGHPVYLLSTHAADSRTLTLREEEGVYQHTFPVKACSETTDISQLLITTKANMTQQALLPLLPHLKSGTVLFFLQNGMGAEDFIYRERPDLVVINGITTDGVYRPSKNELILAGRGETLIGAQYHDYFSQAKDVFEQFKCTHAVVNFASDIMTPRWYKLAVNCVINPLTAIFRCSNGEILEHSESQAMIEPLCEEIAAVMRVEGIAASTGLLVEKIVDTAQKTAKNISSMYADILAQQETEIEYMNGFVVRCAKRHGIPVSRNRQLLQQINNLARLETLSS